jgi:hypothetical protein
LASTLRHWFKDAKRDLSFANHVTDGTGYNLWSTGLERRGEMRDANSTVLKATESDWSQRAPISWGSFQMENDNRIVEERNYLDTGSFGKTATSYDAYNNPTEIQEYDFDGLIKRKTSYSYKTDSTYLADAVHLLRLPLQQTIKNGQDVVFAQTFFEYDNYAQDGNHAALQGYASVSGHDTAYGAGKMERGNATTVLRWVSGSQFTYEYSRFDILGNVVSIKDPRSNVTQYSFADDFGDGSNPGYGTAASPPTYALATLITSPPPNSGESVQTTRSQYDFSTGRITGFKDRNGVVIKAVYNDPFDRPTLVISALGTAERDAEMSCITSMRWY